MEWMTWKIVTSTSFSVAIVLWFISQWFPFEENNVRIQDKNNGIDDLKNRNIHIILSRYCIVIHKSMVSIRRK